MLAHSSLRHSNIFSKYFNTSIQCHFWILNLWYVSMSVCRHDSAQICHYTTVSMQAYQYASVSVWNYIRMQVCQCKSMHSHTVSIYDYWACFHLPQFRFIKIIKKKFFQALYIMHRVFIYVISWWKKKQDVGDVVIALHP